jgi:hypothetical protein
MRDLRKAQASGMPQARAEAVQRLNREGWGWSALEPARGSNRMALASSDEQFCEGFALGVTVGLVLLATGWAIWMAVRVVLWLGRP